MELSDFIHFCWLEHQSAFQTWGIHIMMILVSEAKLIIYGFIIHSVYIYIYI